MAQKIGFRLLTNFKTNLQETPKDGGTFWRVSMLASFSHKNGFVFIEQIWHNKALNQYSIAQKTGFMLLTDFKTNL